uniref:Interferon-inducible GTPase 5-like n=1 Tax=Haplochromis burtoni TaxID=8153 RepID=A0A3Q2WJ91_HAPBU
MFFFFNSNNDTAAAAAKIQENLKQQNNIPLNIAITGESGSGKSTFVNAFRELCDDEEGAAPTGVTETTSEVTPYPHPNYPNVTFWDLPGIGTTNFPAKKYLKLVGFQKFDFFIIISDTRFRENDVKLAKEIQKMKKKFYFVRTKIDNNIRDEKRKKDFNEEETLTKIREDYLYNVDMCFFCETGLSGLGIKSPQVFLVSTFELHLYDFPLLQQTLERDLPSNKRDTLLFVMPNINPEIIIKKKKSFKRRLYWLATLSALGAAVPVPGLSIAVDVAVLAGAVTHYVHAFGLDVPSLARLSDRTGVPYADLCAVILSPLAAAKITIELLMKVEVSRFIPIVGIPLAMGLSFATTYTILKSILNELADDAEKVFVKALGLNTSV